MVFKMDPKGFMRIAKQSTVLRLLIQSAWTTHYSEIHRISSLARALAAFFRAALAAVRKRTAKHGEAMRRSERSEGWFESPRFRYNKTIPNGMALL